MVSILNLRNVKGSSIKILDTRPSADLLRQGKVEDILRTPTYPRIGVKIETTISRILKI